LTEISAQNRWAKAFYKELNMAALEDCMKLLSGAVERFTVCVWINDFLGSGG
jgi:hypothetical protein